MLPSSIKKFLMKKISLKDIALKAGVSVSTVSFVINNKARAMRISEDKIKKVTEIVEKMEFKPNQIARSLRTGSTKTIGLIVEDISNQFFSNLAKVIETEAKKHHYRVIYSSTDNNPEKACELIRLMSDTHVDGFIITPTEGLEKEIAELTDSNKPVVLVDRFYPKSKFSYVAMDNFYGAYQATDLLISKGYQNIGLVTNDMHLIQMQQRYDGYESALKANSRKVSRKLIKSIKFDTDYEISIYAMMEFLKSQPQMDAILFLTNYLGITGLEAIRNLGLNIPADIAVVSFDDNDLFRLNNPSISVIRQPVEKMGAEAVSLLLESIRNKKAIMNKQVIEKGKLIIRNSVKS